MKIQAVNSVYNYPKQRLQNKQTADCNTYPAFQPQFTLKVTPNINYALYNAISFRGNEQSVPEKKQPVQNEHLSMSQLLNAGYELAKVEDGRIANGGNNVIIRDAKALIALSQSEKAWKKNYVLAADIDLKGQDFQGIGNLKRAYSGVFDGNGYILSNLSVIKPDSNMVGFFRTCNNAEIKNLKLENAQIKGKSDVGSVAGSAENNTILSNIVCSGTINGGTTVGGIVGYAKNSTAENCLFSGTVQSASNNNGSDEDDNFFTSETKSKNNNDSLFIGGIFGISENSTISASGVNANISGKTAVGGLAGLAANWAEIRNCIFSGNVTAAGKAGYFAGWAKNSKISNSYSLTSELLIGENEESKLSGCFSEISSLNDNVHSGWNRDIWNIVDRKLPRLKSELKQLNPIDVFIEDLNIDIKNKNIRITDINYVPPKTIAVKLDDMEPPKHYSENEPVLAEINRCTSPAKLAELFAYWTDDFRCGFSAEDKKHDEILLALVKNKNLDMNERWDGFGASIWCTPLYVLSALNKGVIFKEALKREDINPFIQNGPRKETDMFRTLYEAPIATNMFLLFDSKNPKVREYLKQRLAQSPGYPSEDRLTNLLCANLLDSLKYNETSNEILIPKKMLSELDGLKEVKFRGNDSFASLWDIVSSPDISGSYTDSQGNNILHLLSQKSIPDIERLKYLETAVAKGADLNAKNNNGETPYMLAINSKSHLLYSRMLEHGIAGKFYTDNEGNNALLVNTKYNQSKQAVLIADKLHKTGFSLNSRDNAQSTPLIEAVKNNDMRQINYLLTNGAAVDLCDENGQTALHHAFMQQNLQAIKWLMDSFACLETKDKLGLKPKDYWPDCASNEDFAGLNWDAAMFEYNFAGISDADFSSFNMTDIAGIQKEVENTRSFNPNNLQAKGSALEKSLIKLYYYLCKFPDALDKAKANGFLEQLAQTNNPYSLECILKILNDCNADINYQNKDGETPLLLALKSYKDAETTKEKLSCMQNIKCLLDNGAKVDIADSNGQTAVHHAVFSNNIMLFNELLGKHPNVNATDILGRNPIQYISKNPEDPMRKIYDLYAKKRALNN